MNSSKFNRIFSPLTLKQFLLIIFLISSVIFVRFISPEDNWICQNGEWVKHGYPTSDKPSINCSGQPEIVLTQNHTQINLHFNKTDESFDCSQTYPIIRQMEISINDPQYYQLILHELFKGPNPIEIEEGYTSVFSEATSSILKSVNIVDQNAYINLTDIREIIPNVSASCGSQQFLAEIKNTLIANGPITDVFFAIDGDPQTFYDWIQVGCDPSLNNCQKEMFSH